MYRRLHTWLLIIMLRMRLRGCELDIAHAEQQAAQADAWRAHAAELRIRLILLEASAEHAS